MQFSAVIVAAILAYTATAAPAIEDRNNLHWNTKVVATGAPATSTAAPSPSGTNAPAPGASLSLTAQLTLADTAVDRFALLSQDSQFVFNFNDANKKGKGGKAGDIIAANRKTFPALVGTGAGMAVGFLDGCGFNTPHVHPRSVELQIVTKGRLVTEMVPENGVFVNNDPKQGRRVITNTIMENEMTPFYLGSIHTQFNPDCTPATFVAAFNNEDFGAGQVLDETFSFSPDVVAAAFGQAVSGADVDKFKKAIPVSIAAGVEECLRKCNIAKR